MYICMCVCIVMRCNVIYVRVESVFCVEPGRGQWRAGGVWVWEEHNYARDVEMSVAMPIN